MKDFVALYQGLDETGSTLEKVELLKRYFARVPPRDAGWAVRFLCGWRPKRLVGYRALGDWGLALTNTPAWMMAECYSATGDLAETLALLLDALPAVTTENDTATLPLHVWMEERILPLGLWDEAAQRVLVVNWWKELPRAQRLVLNKLITGELRVGVSQTLTVRALSEASGVPAAVLQQRLMGAGQPDAEFYTRLTSPSGGPQLDGAPYPFCLAHALDVPPESLGDVTQWAAEWKWDGIRSQVVRREALHIWTRGEELVTPRFPELHPVLNALPKGTVLDGEILAFQDGAPLPFAALQKRIGRVKPAAKDLAGSPVALLAYDLLEDGGVDVRGETWVERRARLERLAAATPGLLLSTVHPSESWEALAALRGKSRERGVEGLMLKRRDSTYGVGRKKGEWWKWKIDPMSMDAVLLYAHAGSGKRGGLFTDYTFGVWMDGALVPIAKAYSGLNDDEIAELDAWVRANTQDRFGPTRAVPHTQVFELSFEAIAPSTRHKAGVAVRFPRITRWRKDKRGEEADTLERVKALLTAPL